jgi:hypothetical protein
MGLRDEVHSKYWARVSRGSPSVRCLGDPKAPNNGAPRRRSFEILGEGVEGSPSAQMK